jgi:hypothetical protein
MHLKIKKIATLAKSFSGERPECVARLVRVPHFLSPGLIRPCEKHPLLAGLSR